MISPDYGFTAIIVAFLGRLNPIGIIFASLVVALTYLGAETAQIFMQIPKYTGQVFQGMILFFLLASDYLLFFKIKFLGIKKYTFGELETENKVGVATGLAWTEFGGEILKIESVHMAGKGKMQITGKLGEVMQESIKAAKSYVRSKSLEYGIIPPIFEKKDFHIHVPEGATPKDGPSAGIAMVTSIVSSITDVPIRKDLAMTGEVTLTGQVLAIGGLKEKLLAAHRAGIKEVLLPKDNEKDLKDIPKKVKEDIKLTIVSNVDEVLKIALTKELKPIKWVEVDTLTKSNKDQETPASRH